MQRVMEYYLETGDSSVKNLIKKWVDWVMSEIKLYDDGTFAIPSDARVVRSA